MSLLSANFAYDNGQGSISPWLPRQNPSSKLGPFYRSIIVCDPQFFLTRNFFPHKQGNIAPLSIGRRERIEGTIRK